MTDPAIRPSPRLDHQSAAAATAPVVAPIILCELEFGTGPFRVWTGLGDLHWAGKIFEGIGDLGAMSDIEETIELRAIRVDLILSPVPQEVVDWSCPHSADTLTGCWERFSSSRLHTSFRTRRARDIRWPSGAGSGCRSPR